MTILNFIWQLPDNMHFSFETQNYKKTKLKIFQNNKLLKECFFENYQLALGVACLTLVETTPHVKNELSDLFKNLKDSL